MPHDVPTILRTLADLYRKSAAGSHGSARDFTCDYEQLLRLANCHDGDEREKAEDDLKRAEISSGGLLSLDRAPRSAMLLRVRLARDGGEAWLFTRIGRDSPSDKRSDLAGFFVESGKLPVPEHWRDAWTGWCAMLAGNAAANRSIQPFKRDDPEDNHDFRNTLLGVIHWQGESLIRYASSVICGDSKKLENQETRLVSALQAIRSDTTLSLENLGILRKPRTLTFHGPLVLRIAGGTVDFTSLPGPTRISEVNLVEADQVFTKAPLCLAVENEEVFLEVAKQNCGWLLVHTSFPGSAVRRLFDRLGPDLTCWHFGDSDPAGFDILRDLREKTGRDFKPVCMEFRPDPSSPRLTDDDRRTIARLLDTPMMEDIHPVLESMLNADSKGMFEQESVSLDRIIERISMSVRKSD
jgi:hypothetical protein